MLRWRRRRRKRRLSQQKCYIGDLLVDQWKKKESNKEQERLCGRMTGLITNKAQTVMRLRLFTSLCLFLCACAYSSLSAVCLVMLAKVHLHACGCVRVCPCGLSKEKDDGTELFKGQQQTHHQTGRQRGALITTSEPAHKRTVNCTAATTHSRIQSDTNRR